MVRSEMKSSNVATLLTVSKSILIIWASRHCGLPVTELADHQDTLGEAETEPNNTLNTATPRAPIRRSCNPLQHERLKEVHTPLTNGKMETSFSKTEHTELARFHSGHYHALRHWQHLVGVSDDAITRLCGGEALILQNNYGYDAQRPWWKATIGT